jgi:hypothetical protein
MDTESKMYALLDENNIVVNWCFESELDLHPSNKSVLMTKDNSPATINGKWDGSKFIHPANLEMENA